MRKATLWKTVLLMLAAAVLSGCSAAAQGGRGQGQGHGPDMKHGKSMGRGMGESKGMPMYDPASELTVTGTVQEVIEQGGSMGAMGTHLFLNTEEGDLEVHLGPSDYLAGLEFTLNKGDRIEITGSKLKQQGVDLLIARKVRRGSEVLVLRDEQGRPAWAGSGKSQRGGGRY